MFTVRHMVVIARAVETGAVHTRREELILLKQPPMVRRVPGPLADDLTGRILGAAALEIRPHGLDEAGLVGLGLVRVREEEDGVVVPQRGEEVTQLEIFLVVVSIRSFDMVSLCYCSGRGNITIISQHGPPLLDLLLRQTRLQGGQAPQLDLGDLDGLAGPVGAGGADEGREGGAAELAGHLGDGVDGGG